MKITPVLYMEEIEKSLPFWVDRMGFTKTVEVPEGSRLGFVILEKAGSQIMLQTWESMRKDMPSLVQERGRSSALFIEVDDFADVRKRLEGAQVVVPERVTWYGMREIVVREPGGHDVCFAFQEKK